jgi:DNA processing protein
MSDESQVRDLMIALSFLPHLTPSRTRLLLEYFDPLPAVCNASTAVLAGLLSMEESQAAQVKQALQNPRIRHGVDTWRERVLTLADAVYPAALKSIIDPPLTLWTSGETSLFAKPALAIVGSRRASPYAINVARSLAARLTDAGFGIISGLARGVDAAAHEAALDAGGSTIAVLGTGIDLCYPPANRRLLERIAAEGLLVTEFAPSTPPRKSNFPIRNRVISGLSAGVIIVEATGRSGSLITARMAAEQGREVFAVPGSIFSTGTEGTHRLIQYGAKLVHDVDDVLDELKDEVRARAKPRPAAPPLSPELREVLEVFTRSEGLHVDHAAAQLGRPVATLAEALLQLELNGYLRALPGARYIRSEQ